MDFDAVADELYGLRPEHFTATRDTRAAEARTTGDRALAERIGALRRPSPAAWASNLLVRAQPDQVEPLLRLGEGLRRAHHDLDGAQLRELVRQQRALVGALSRQAAHLAAQAGRRITPDAQREVERTLQAVLADPEAAREWAAGRLVKALDAAVGFPSVAQDAVRRAPAVSAVPAPAARRESAAAENRRARLAEARQEAEHAEGDLRTAEAESAAAAGEAADAQQRADRLHQRVGSLTEELRRAEEEHRQAVAAERQARERARFADRRVTEARRHASSAAARVKRLTEKTHRTT
ncbi:hypothetical protein [Streptomyces cinereospinus]|uniref:Uncharacterized protein n=1 Tax=Streptomyces cinereospinus TaxID=285561 RepID=A0ABV5MTA5_9ACTN